MSKPGEKLERRRKLFAMYSANLAFFEPRAVGLYRCPICSRFFDAQSVEGRNPLVDIAHVYPESCGGELEVLTCADCNSRIGSRYDSHLATEKKIHDAWSRGEDGSEIRASMIFEQFGDAKINGWVVRQGEGIVFRQGKDCTNPADTKAVEDGLRTPPDQLRWKFEFNGPSQQHVAVSLLHAAYLMMFYQYGYEYPYFTETDWIREILTADNPPEQVPVIFLHSQAGRTKGIEREVTLDEIVHRTGFIRHGTGIRCMVALFPTSSGEGDLRGVMLPGFGPDGKADWEKIISEPNGRKSAPIELELGSRDERLADEKFAIYGRWKWTQHGKKDASNEYRTGI